MLTTNKSFTLDNNDWEIECHPTLFKLKKKKELNDTMQKYLSHICIYSLVGNLEYLTIVIKRMKENNSQNVFAL